MLSSLIAQSTSVAEASELAQPVKQRILELVDTALYHLMPKESPEENAINLDTAAVESKMAADEKEAAREQTAADSLPKTQKRGSALYKLVNILGESRVDLFWKSLLLSIAFLNRNVGCGESTRNSHRTSDDDEAVRVATTPTSRAYV